MNVGTKSLFWMLLVALLQQNFQSAVAVGTLTPVPVILVIGNMMWNNFFSNQDVKIKHKNINILHLSSNEDLNIQYVKYLEKIQQKTNMLNTLSSGEQLLKEIQEMSANFKYVSETIDRMIEDIDKEISEEQQMGVDHLNQLKQNMNHMSDSKTLIHKTEVELQNFLANFKMTIPHFNRG